MNVCVCVYVRTGAGRRALGVARVKGEERNAANHLDALRLVEGRVVGLGKRGEGKAGGGEQERGDCREEESG